MEQRILEHLRARFSGGIRRVLLVNPPGVAEKDFRVDMARDRRYWSYPPYGCAVLAGNLRDAGYEADILDLNYVMLKRAHNWPHYVYDYEWKTGLYFALEDFKADVVAVSTMFTMQHEPMKEIVLKCADWGVPVVAGGLHCTNARKQVLEDVPQLEFVGLYEGDLSFPALLDAINGKAGIENVCQVALRLDGEFVSVDKRMPPRLDAIKAPAWDDIDLTEYDAIGQVGTYHFLRGDERKASSLLAKRGCRAKCSFCSVRFFNGPGVRTREISDVLDEICELKAKGIRHITWLDDDLLFNREESLALFKEMTRLGGMTWDGSNGLIAAAVDEELLDWMVASGCVGFNLGIESGSPEILRAVHKPGTVESFRKCAKLCEKYPELFIKAFVICGFPGETLAQMKQTVDLCVELKYDWCSLQILNPLPSTEIFRTMADQGFITDNINTEGKSFTAGVFSSLNLRQREERERQQASEFTDLFDGDLSRVPEKSEMADIWLTMDYRMNYEPIFGMQRGPKLENKRKILIDICDRITHENPLANFFLMQVEAKLGNHDETVRRSNLTREYLDKSEYWQKRFFRLGLA
jgi:radical SAM superfamily enzyme YgiQ (UPF0313 family)